jgi:hypothetical protein
MYVFVLMSSEFGMDTAGGGTGASIKKEEEP